MNKIGKTLWIIFQWFLVITITSISFEYIEALLGSYDWIFHVVLFGGLGYWIYSTIDEEPKGPFDDQ